LRRKESGERKFVVVSHPLFVFNSNSISSLFFLLFRFEQAIRSTPDNTSMLCQYAQVLTTLALRKAHAGEECFSYFEKAFQKYNLARDLNGLIELGNSIQSLRDNLSIWKERNDLFGLAIKCYEEVIKADDRNTHAYANYGDMLVLIARKQNDQKAYLRAGTN
jgi:tetratricopeptide (TPR) repeat protein